MLEVVKQLLVYSKLWYYYTGYTLLLWNHSLVAQNRMKTNHWYNWRYKKSKLPDTYPYIDTIRIDKRQRKNSKYRVHDYHIGNNTPDKYKLPNNEPKS
jgi:hypothetical protein